MKRIPILLLLVLMVGCTAQVRLRQITDATWFERENRNGLDSRDPSERTVQFLRREDLSGRYFKEPRAVLVELHDRLMEERSRELAFHLAELCYVEGRLGWRSAADEAALYLSTIRYAYAYLFDPQLEPAVSPYDPSFRWACDFYNRALARLMQYTRGNDDLDRQDGVLTLPTLTGNLRVSLGAHPDHWDMEGFSQILIAFNYDVTGLPGRARNYGVGVPLILVKPVTAAEASFRPPIVDKLVNSRSLDEIELNQSYAATAFLRIPGSILEDNHSDVAWFELHNSMEVDHFEVDGQIVPVESDLTSPLAHVLSQQGSDKGLSGMFNPEDTQDITGLFLLQPLDPDKIPVLFVHGLMSSPMTWMRLFNDLISDPRLRHRCQFMFFRYPTGNPVALSAAVLRDTMHGYRESLDPERTNPNFDETLVVGHSMGGLLTKMQILDGGDAIWNKFADVPLDEMDLTDEEKEVIRACVYFDRNQDIRRVVFMATPHRGSDLATGFVGWLGRSLITLPGRVATITTNLRGQLGNAARRGLGRSVDEDPASGVKDLAPNSFISTELAEMPLPEEVPFHSIIGNVEVAGVAGGSDGVVPYPSSHLDGAQSELIVKSGHNVQESTAALVELRRILHQHLDEVDARRAQAANETEDTAAAETDADQE